MSTPERWEMVSGKLKPEAEWDGSRYSRKPIGRDQSRHKLDQPTQRLKWWRPRTPIFKKSRLMNMIKRPRRGTTMDDKGQADNGEITTKKEGFNVKILNSSMTFYDDSERRIWWIG